jgi:fatty acid desaturase
VIQTQPLPRRRAELPTLVIAFLVYAGFLCLTLCFEKWSLWVAAPLCAIVLAWYGSLQHETIHGHPTPSRRINAMLACVPLSLWIPYALYRKTHLEHHSHQGRRLTEVPHDPESFYLSRGAFEKLGPFRKALHRANCTFAGRLLLGPALAVASFWTGELHAIRSGDRWRLRVWLRHLAAVAGVLGWVVGVCHISVAVYLLLVVYPSISLTHVRSFAEHHAEEGAHRRTRAVESSGPWSLLFLNNNLHIAHHAHPQIPWYRLPETWRGMRASVPASDVIAGGYWEVMRRYLFRPYIAPEHPLPGTGP